MPAQKTFLQAENKHAVKITHIMDAQFTGVTDEQAIEERLREITKSKSIKLAAFRANQEMYGVGVKDVAKQLSKLIQVAPSINHADDVIIGALTEHTINSLAFIAEDIKPALIDALQEGRKQGEGQRKLALRVQDIWDSNRSRATNFARTEGNEIYNQAHLIRYGEAGVEAVEVSAVMDERTTLICQMLNGTIWRIDDPELRRPPYHFGCRTRLIAYFGKIPGERDFTDWTNGKNITPSEVDTLTNRITQFRTKYWDVPAFNP